jgi:TolB protein
VAFSAAFASPSAQAAFPGANGKISFETNRSGDSGTEVYAINPDGSGEANLTRTPGFDAFAAWSPDGTKLVFERYTEIYTMNSDGTGQTRLTNNTADDSRPAWSPDGLKIVFMSNRDGHVQLYTMNSDGSAVTRLTNNPEGDWDPVWSPDGSEIAFERCCVDSNNGDIFTIKPDGTGETRVTTNGAFNPSWSPDGSKIAYAARRSCSPGDCNADIYVMNADGTGQVDLTNTPSLDEFYPAWSPDGTRIAFTRPPDIRGFGEIWTMNPDGSGQTNITNNPADDAGPDWQPLPTASYERPQSASPISVSLVPLFRQCGTGATPVNGRHAPPLGTGSCTPPSPSSNVARVGSSSQGLAQLAVISGDTDPTNGDQADVTITAHLTDVLATGGGDYNPNSAGADLTEITRLRLTDRSNNYGGASGTTTDLDFSAPVDCTTTTGPEGSSCDAATSADAVIPGAIQEQRGTIAQIFRVRLYDSGANGVRENGAGDDRIFAHQGIYIP